MKFKFFIAALFMSVLAACGKQEPAQPAPPTDAELRAQRLAQSAENQKLQDMLGQNRATARANIGVGVAEYFAANPRFQPAKDWSVITHTDDYIDSSCPQGSGWGWANIMNTKLKDENGGPVKYKVYCSTFDAALGCYIENDFKSGPHAKESARCNDNIPSPLKPIGR